MYKAKTGEQLKTAYKALARKWHPDKNYGREKEATEIFQQIGAAFDELVEQFPQKQ